MKSLAPDRRKSKERQPRQQGERVHFQVETAPGARNPWGSWKVTMKLLHALRSQWAQPQGMAALP